MSICTIFMTIDYDGQHSEDKLLHEECFTIVFEIFKYINEKHLTILF